MNITALFVEQLIIGLGVLCWLVLLIAYVLGIRLDSSLFQINPILIAPLTAVAYIFGIIADRLIRDPFIFLVEGPARKKVHKEYGERIDRIKKVITSLGNALTEMELEKFVRSNSRDLGQKINYNRNRLKICRAWIVHFLLITIAFYAWNNKVKAFDSLQQNWLVTTGILLFAVTLYTAIKLSIDHQRDIIESSEIILSAKKGYTRDNSQLHREGERNFE